MEVSILDNLVKVPKTDHSSYVLRFVLLEKEIVFLLDNGSYKEALEFLESFTRKTGWLAVSQPMPRMHYNEHISELRRLLDGDNRT